MIARITQWRPVSRTAASLPSCSLRSRARLRRRPEFSGWAAPGRHDRHPNNRPPPLTFAPRAGHPEGDWVEGIDQRAIDHVDWA
ncbi:hypothetical protein NXT3_PB00351 (plasmid) [Sinorhizobium fredii]|uniref:Uncharacterized protein n=1 Tax=Rhizobium fredii TaxID=380 RepID=A0A2L0HC15_RHIFR|nr:hypothetical protein NXT3_PB00351 [Sinorhizobium fredii]